MSKMKKFKVKFYTNVVYPTADDVSQDQFTRYYYASDIKHVPTLVDNDLQENKFLLDEDLTYTHWYYRTQDVTSYSIQEMKEEE